MQQVLVGVGYQVRTSHRRWEQGNKTRCEPVHDTTPLSFAPQHLRGKDAVCSAPLVSFLLFMSTSLTSLKVSPIAIVAIAAMLCTQCIHAVRPVHPCTQGIHAFHPGHHCTQCIHAVHPCMLCIPAPRVSILCIQCIPAPSASMLWVHACVVEQLLPFSSASPGGGCLTHPKYPSQIS